MELTSVSSEQLLKDAVEKPGIISDAFRLFHNYSTGNQLLAMRQCRERGIEPGIIHTFKGWQSVKRQVRKGEKAIALCMPVTCKLPGEAPSVSSGSPADGPASEARGFTRFIFRNNWFVISQTDGEPVAVPPLPNFDIEHALQALEIQRVPFDEMDGNIQGFAINRSIAISPVADEPLRTTFHEVAHIVLGHTSEGKLSDSPRTPQSIREVEAEAVAMLCCASLGLPGVEFSRGYIQHWYGSSQPIPEKSAQKIFKVANQILVAGRVGPQTQLAF